MRHLLLLRHAKSSWDDLGLDDHDRPLAPRGEKALKKLRAHLRGGDLRVDLVICSSSARTRQTLEGIRPALPRGVKVSIEPDIYLAGAEVLLARLRRVDARVRSTMLVGHNPGMEDLAGMLVGSGDEQLRAALAAKYPTGALAHLTFAGTWADLAPGSASLDELFVPRPPRLA